MKTPPTQIFINRLDVSKARDFYWVKIKYLKIKWFQFVQHFLSP